MTFRPLALQNPAKHWKTAFPATEILKETDRDYLYVFSSGKTQTKKTPNTDTFSRSGRGFTLFRRLDS